MKKPMTFTIDEDVCVSLKAYWASSTASMGLPPDAKILSLLVNGILKNALVAKGFYKDKQVGTTVAGLPEKKV